MGVVVRGGRDEDVVVFVLLDGGGPALWGRPFCEMVLFGAATSWGGGSWDFVPAGKGISFEWEKTRKGWRGLLGVG